MKKQNLPKVDLKTSPQVDYDFPINRQAWNGLVLVGEAPGRDEVKLGHPFVGRSGQLLNETLEQAGISRPQCLVANVFRFQPPGNKVDHFFTSKRAAQENAMSLMEDMGKFGSLWCQERYRTEINALSGMLQTWKPQLIVALGRTPLWALTGENGLLGHIGNLLECRLAPGIPVLPTYHPSYILRGNWALRPSWVEHFQAARTFKPHARRPAKRQ